MLFYFKIQLIVFGIFFSEKFNIDKNYLIQVFMFAIFLTLVAGATYEVTSLLQTFTLSGSLMGTSTLQSNSGPAIYYLLTCRATSYALTAYDSGGASYTIPVDTQSNNAYYVPYPRSRLECRVPILNQDTIIAICGLTGCENGLHFLERSPIICLLYTSPSPRD